MKITIRMAEQRDIPRLHEMLGQIGSLHFHGRPDIFNSNAVKFSEDDLRELLTNEDAPVFVAEDAAALVGYSFCRIKSVCGHPVLKSRQYLYIDDLYVDERCRREHIGQRLFDAARLFASSRGLDAVELNVWAFNHGAVRFYESRGMTVQRMEMELPLPRLSPIGADGLPACLGVIRESFAAVAADLGLTPESCPEYTGFLTLEALQARLEQGWELSGLSEGDTLIGCLLLSDEGNGALALRALAVLPQYRHRGYGTLLLAHAKEKVRAHGGETLTLGIIGEDAVRRVWCLKNGFVRTGSETPAHLPFTVDLMEWKE